MIVRVLASMNLGRIRESAQATTRPNGTLSYGGQWFSGHGAGNSNLAE